jgi:hypothetical protein
MIRYRTEIPDARMPKPVASASMPMASYLHEPIEILEVAAANADIIYE